MTKDLVENMMNEKLSAFIDAEIDELEERRVLDALATDAELRAAWERYHLMRAVIRNELDDVLVPGLSERIVQRIQTVPSPRILKSFGKIIPGSVLKTVGALAIAASVAAVAIVGLQTLNKPDAQTSTPVAFNDTSWGEHIRAGTTHWDMDQPELESALNVYLVEHNEFASTGMNSMFPYVRVVVYDSDQ